MKKTNGQKRKTGTDKNPSANPVRKGKTVKGSKVNG